MKRLYLASTSSGRLKMLKTIGVVPDKIIAPDVDESHLIKERGRDLSIRLAKKKCLAVFDMLETADKVDTIILSGDTVVSVGTKILEKAENDKTVESYLRTLSNKTHKLHSSFCLIDCNTGQSILKTVESRIKFRKITEKEIEMYVNIKEGIGNAGGYTLQGFAECFVEQIVGSYSNIIGLPLSKLKSALDAFNYNNFSNLSLVSSIKK